MLLKDKHGSSIGFLDGERVHDENGGSIATRESDDREEFRLARIAAYHMTGRVSDRYRPTGEEIRTCRDEQERAVLLDLGPSDVVTPSARDDGTSLGANDAGCVADMASSVRVVTRDRGYLWTENATDMVRLVVPNAGSSGTPSEVNPSYTQVPFTTNAYALVAKLPRMTLKNADFDLKAQTTRFLIEILRLAREQRVANLLLNPANWAAANTVAASAAWNTGPGADPLTDLFAALAPSLLPADLLVVPEVLDRYFYQAANTSVRDYVQARGKLPVRVVTAAARSLVGGVTKYIWSPATLKNVVLVRSPENPYRIPTSATLRWFGDERADKGARVDGFFVRTFSDQANGEFGSDYVVVVHNDAEIQVNSTANKCQVGALITGATT